MKIICITANCECVDRDKAARLMVEKYNANKKAKNIHGQIPLDLVSDRDDPRWAGVLTSAPLVSMQEKM
jgi:hypothetical protein